MGVSLVGSAHLSLATTVANISTLLQHLIAFRIQLSYRGYLFSSFNCLYWSNFGCFSHRALVFIHGWLYLCDNFLDYLSP